MVKFGYNSYGRDCQLASDSGARPSGQLRSDITIGLMSLLLYVFICAAFFLCLSVNNIFLRVINRTLATTMLTFWAMTFAMHAVYGGYDVGRKKSKPVISSMIAGTVVTDLVTYLQLEIMNVNENNNPRLILFGKDFLLLLTCMVIQILIIILLYVWATIFTSVSILRANV